MITKSGMRPLEIVVTKPETERLRATPGTDIGHGVGPASNQRLDKAFRFPVRLRAIRSRPRQAHPDARGNLLKPPADVGAPVVREDALDEDAATSNH